MNSKLSYLVFNVIYFTNSPIIKLFMMTLLAYVQSQSIYFSVLSCFLLLSFSSIRNTQQTHNIQFYMDFQHVLDELYQRLNQVRIHPHQTANKIQLLKSDFQGRLFKNKYFTRQGITALEDLIINLSQRQPANHRLKWSFALHMAADQQANLLGRNGIVTSQGTRMHRTLQERTQNYAIVKGRLSEVYEFGGRTSQQILQQLLIDDGLSSRKRRTTLLDPIFRYIGIGSSYHETQQCCTVIILAQQIISLVAPEGIGSVKKRAIEVGKKNVINQDKYITIPNPNPKNNKISVVIEPLNNKISDPKSISRQTSLTNEFSPNVKRQSSKNNSQFILEQSIQPPVNKPYTSITPSEKPSFRQSPNQFQQTNKNSSHVRQHSIFNNQIAPKFTIPTENGLIEQYQQPRRIPKPALVEKKEGSVIIYEPNPNSSQFFNHSLMRSGAPESDSVVYQTYNPMSRSQEQQFIQDSKAAGYEIKQQHIQSWDKIKQNPQNSTNMISGQSNKQKQSKCQIM